MGVLARDQIGGGSLAENHDEKPNADSAKLAAATPKLPRAI